MKQIGFGSALRTVLADLIKDGVTQDHIAWAWLAAMIALPTWFGGTMLVNGIEWIPDWVSRVLFFLVMLFITLYMCLERNGTGPVDWDSPVLGLGACGLTGAFLYVFIPFFIPDAARDARPSQQTEPSAIAAPEDER